MFGLLRSPRAWCAALAACLAAMTGSQAMPAEPLASIDLTRYSGRWYVIAHAPAFPTRAVGAYFEYRARPDGRIAETFSAREGSFDKAPVTTERTLQPDPQRAGRWSARRGWFGTDEERVLYVSADYRQAIEAGPERDEGWILAREPEIPEWTYAGLLARVAMQGYDASRFRRVPQKPEQLGWPGFE